MLRRPYVVALGVLLRYLIMPAVAFGVGHLLQLPLELLVGLVVVGSCPGGTVSNVICYLARADVALSVILTLLAVVATPALAGVVLNWQFSRFLRSVEAVFPLFSVATIALVIGIIVALSQQSIATYWPRWRCITAWA